jgi:hypothetical protein
MDIEIASTLDIKIDTRETFWNLYCNNLSSLYPNLFIRTKIMLLSDHIFRYEGLIGRKILTSSDPSSMDNSLTYLDKEWEIYEIF